MTALKYIPLISAASRIGMTAGELRTLCDSDDLDCHGGLIGLDYYVTSDTVERLKKRAAPFGETAL